MQLQTENTGNKHCAAEPLTHSHPVRKGERVGGGGGTWEEWQCAAVI